MFSQFHEFTQRIRQMTGFETGDQIPEWLHLALHVVLVIAPLATVAISIILLFQLLKRHLRDGVFRAGETGRWFMQSPVLGLRWQEQAVLVALGLLAQPVLYASLELPKRIVNNAIDSGHFPIEPFGIRLEQLDLLIALAVLYLFTLFLGGVIKYRINVKKGEIGERTLLRLRLTLYRAWRKIPPDDRKADIIPVSTNEIEPIGGFTGEVLATPVFQGGTLVTVLLFMIMQDPVLGAAALTLVPFQMFLIPLLQKRVNLRMRARIFAVRQFGDTLGEQTTETPVVDARDRTCSAIKDMQTTRLSLQRAKFLQKAVSNFLMSLTPFLLYSIGGWLVIEGRLSLGALVAVIVAFKDFSAPFRALLMYYQNLSDVKLRATEYTAFLARCGFREGRVWSPLAGTQVTYDPVGVAT